jgi:hypothetical protein
MGEFGWIVVLLLREDSPVLMAAMSWPLITGFDKLIVKRRNPNHVTDEAS